MEKVKLIEICNPKQWKTLATGELMKEGEYPVYGANGIIGYYDRYNHEKETVLITCRGATCGNIHISKEKSYINGNAMALDNLREDVCLKKYLFYFLKRYDMKKIITGSAQPQITVQGLKKIEIKLYDLKKQNAVIEELDKAQEIIDIRKKQIEKFDELIKSQFVEMFGDINFNNKEWNEDILKNNLTVVGGYAFKSSEFQESGIPILRIGNINTGKFRPKDLMFWKEDNSLENYAIYPNDVLMSLTGTVGKEDYGNVCIIGNDYPKYYLNQRNAKLNIKETINKEYISYALRVPEIKRRLTGISRGVRQANISNRDIENLKIPIPPIELQNNFAEFIKQVNKQKFEIQKSLEEMLLLQESLMNKYFG